MKISGNQHIHFGTDGWRGIIAKDFTLKNASIIAQAIADYIKQNSELSIENSGKMKTNSKFLILNSAVIVGYDNRFLSEKFALEIAKVISGNDISVSISDTAVTSPSISFFCKLKNIYGIRI